MIVKPGNRVGRVECVEGSYGNDFSIDLLPSEVASVKKAGSKWLELAVRLLTREEAEFLRDIVRTQKPVVAQ